MSLAARVAKLELIQQQVLRCAWCRYALHTTVPSVTGKPKGFDDVLPTKCWNCGTRFVVPLRGLNDKQREAVALMYNSHPTKQFTDERVNAAPIWLHLYHSEVKLYKKRTQELADRKLAGPNQYSQSYNRTRGSLSSIEGKAKRDREELEQRATEFHHAQTEHFQKLANGPESFPLDQQIEAIEQEFPTSGYNDAIADLMRSLGFEGYSQSVSNLRSSLVLCNLHLQKLKKREACEIVLWGQALSETHVEIAFFEEEKQHAINEAQNQFDSVTQVLL